MSPSACRSSLWLVHLRLPEGRPRRLALEGLLVTAAAQLLAVLVLGMWSRDRVAQPLVGRSDIVFHAALVRSMQLTGWHSAGPYVGAPNGQDLADFPLGGDNAQLVALRLLAELPIGAFTVVNLYYLLSFGLIAGVTHLTLRSLGSDAVPAAGTSFLYAFLPYHFVHGPNHLFISMYVAVPIAILLAVWVADGRLSWRNPWWRWATAGAFVLVVGSASAYYAVFGTICIVTAAGVGAVRARSPRPALVGALTAAAIAAVLSANLGPTLLHRRAEGENIEVAQRTAVDSETYGLRPATLVVPEPTHRIPSFASRGRAVNDVPDAGEPGHSLGLVGVLGLVVLLSACFAGLGGGKVPPVLGFLGAMFLVTLLVGARGGGSYLIALAGFTEIRSWGRTSVVIALLGLGALALVASVAARRVGRPAVALTTAVLVVIGLIDQIPLHPTPERGSTIVEVAMERKLVQELEEVLPSGAMVYQMPYMRFPEAGPRARMFDYDALNPYVLGAGDLRWSYGGMRGRSADWQELWMAQPVPVQLRAVAAAGFAALWVNRRGYDDGAADLLPQLTALIGATPRFSDDGMLAWYDLRTFRDGTRAELGPVVEEVGRAVTSVPRAVWTRGFGPLIGPPPGSRLVDDGAVLDLRPASGNGQAAVLLLSVDVPAGVNVAVESDQSSWRSAAPGLQEVRLPIRLENKRTQVRFELDGAESLAFATLTVVDAAALHLLPEADQAGPGP